MKRILKALSTHTLFNDKKITLAPFPIQGYNNDLYLLQMEEKRYTLRHFTTLSIDRYLEYHIHTLAYTHGISTKPILLDTVHKFIISTYQVGTHKHKLTDNNIKTVADTLITLHHIKADAPHIKLNIDISILDPFEYDSVLSHNDLNPQNIIWKNSKPTLIDWEYAGYNDRYFDLACIVIEFKLDSAEYEVFMNRYFKNSSWNREKLEAYIKVYQLVCTQWWIDRN